MMIHVKINKMPGNLLMDCINVDTYVEGDGGKCYCFADLTDEGKRGPDKLHILRYHIREDELVLVREIGHVGRVGFMDSAVTEILKSTLGDKYIDRDRWQMEAWEEFQQSREHFPISTDSRVYPFIDCIDPKDPEEGGSTTTYFCDGNLPLNPKGPHNGHDGK